MPSPTDAGDRALVDLALALAGRGVGRVWPGPAEACVLAVGGRVLARSWRTRAGADDFFARALAAAGATARGSTAALAIAPDEDAARALVHAGVARVLVPIRRPGQGGNDGLVVLRLGATVVEGVAAPEARRLNAGALTLAQLGRPFVTVKAATSLDGRIATHFGHSQWITGAAARARGHLMRAESDAIAVGIGTALADDPELTCRLPGMADRSPVRIVFDGDLRLPPTAKLVTGAKAVPTILVCRDDADPARARPLADAGVDLLRVPAGPDGRPDAAAALAALGGRGLTRLLVEGGGVLIGALAAAGLVDRIAWFRAPMLIGGDGRPAVAPFGVDRLDRAARFVRVSALPVDADVLEIYERVA